MIELTQVALESGPVPMAVAGWGLLVAGVAATALWLRYLYR